MTTLTKYEAARAGSDPAIFLFVSSEAVMSVASRYPTKMSIIDSAAPPPRALVTIIHAAEADATKARELGDTDWEADATELLMRAEYKLGLFLRERQKQKDRWIAAARKEFRPGRKEHCCVCGKFGRFAHAHHVVPLAMQFDRGFTAPDHEHVWLCPNHHAMLHTILFPDDPGVNDAMLVVMGAAAASVIAELEEGEIKLMLELVAMAKEGRTR